MWLSDAKWLLRALFMLDRVKRKRNWETSEAIYASHVLTVRLHVYIPAKCIHTLCISPAAVARLMWQKLPSFPLSLRSTLIPGEHVRWNSPPIKTGISRVHCGNRPSVGKQRVCPSLLPSLTLSLIFTPSPVFLTLTVTLPPLFPPLFSPYILSFLHTPFSSLFFLPLVTHSVNPHPGDSIFHCFPSHLYNYAPWSPLFFLLFIPPFSPSCSHPESP